MRAPTKKSMYEDNAKMVRQLKWCIRVMDDLTAKNIELAMKLEATEKENDGSRVQHGTAQN